MNICTCTICGKQLNMDRWFFPGWHICLSETGIRRRQMLQRMMMQQIESQPLKDQIQNSCSLAGLTVIRLVEDTKIRRVDEE